MSGHIVDWQRRRLLTKESSKVCAHGELLIVWCRDCGLDMDSLTVDFDPTAAVA